MIFKEILTEAAIVVCGERNLEWKILKQSGRQRIF